MPLVRLRWHVAHSRKTGHHTVFPQWQKTHTPKNCHNDDNSVWSNPRRGSGDGLKLLTICDSAQKYDNSNIFITFDIMNDVFLLAASSVLSLHFAELRRSPAGGTERTESCICMATYFKSCRNVNVRESYKMFALLNSLDNEQDAYFLKITQWVIMHGSCMIWDIGQFPTATQVNIHLYIFYLVSNWFQGMRCSKHLICIPRQSLEIKPIVAHNNVIVKGDQDFNQNPTKFHNISKSVGTPNGAQMGGILGNPVEFWWFGRLLIL